jgi:hypothetical protein
VRLSEGRGQAPVAAGLSGGRWRLGRQGRAHGGESLVWHVGWPGKRKESGPEKEMGPTPEE